jgi:hypothetical protein
MADRLGGNGPELAASFAVSRKPRRVRLDMESVTIASHLFVVGAGWIAVGDLEDLEDRMGSRYRTRTVALARDHRHGGYRGAVGVP